MERYEGERLARHHFDYPSCGSTFKNNYSAGRSSGVIFDELGFRGVREGGAMVSEHHANFIFNCGNATASDVLKLAAQMRHAALERADIALDLEVECIGRFERGLLEACGVPSVTDAHNSSKAWAGMLWLPNEFATATSVTPIAEPSYPRQLMRGALMGYARFDREFPTGVMVEVEQLCTRSEAATNLSAPFMRWRTYAAPDSSLFTLKAPEPAAFTDGLWRYGVSELFISSVTDGGYLEFEMTPNGHWVALRFSTPRQRAAGYETLSAALWQGNVTVQQGEGWFGMELSWELLAPFISAEGVIALQCAGSSGQGEFGLFPSWATPSTPTNFHQPQQFYPIRLR
jgi:UDP-N-acetylmuramate dehydrogenase